MLAAAILSRLALLRLPMVTCQEAINACIAHLCALACSPIMHVLDHNAVDSGEADTSPFLLTLQPRLRAWALALGLAAGVVPVIVGTSAVHVFVAVIMERMALSGHVGVVLADVVVGVLFGAGVLAASAGVLLPLIAYCLAGERGTAVQCRAAHDVQVSEYLPTHSQLCRCGRPPNLLPPPFTGFASHVPCAP